MRKKIVAGNWKMNKTIDEAMELAVKLQEESNSFPKNVEVVVAPPALYLATIEMIEDLGFSLSAQNCSHHDFGAFTGETSPAMLKAMNVKYCILGHSERRQYFHETDAIIASKVDGCLRNKVHPIFCCGEVLEERKAGKHFDTVKSKVENALFHLTKEEFAKVVIAYEPVWAIGTGVTASNDEAQEMHAFIRATVEGKYGKEIADAVIILYGGSVNASNSADLFACRDVDGGLVGGASLKANDFMTIIKSAGQA
jgi:triosephosphate isomerase